MTVSVFGEKEGDNNLGLLPVDQQKKPLLGIFKHSAWVSKRAPNNRIAILRELYIELEKRHKTADGDEKTQIENILNALNSGTVENLWEKIPRKNNDLNDPIDKICKKFEEENDNIFSLFQNTYNAAEGNDYGYAFKKKGERDPDLATIITTLSHLYADKSANPILTLFKNSAVFLRNAKDKDNENENEKDNKGPTTKDKRQAVLNLMDHIATVVMNLENMPKGRMNMANSDNDIRMDSLIIPLKRAHNKLNIRIDNPKRFANIGKEREELQAERALQQIKEDRAKQWEKKYKQIIFDGNKKIRLDLLESNRYKNQDGDFIKYKYVDVNVNNLDTQKEIAKKQRMKRIKIAIAMIAVGVALIVAIGQAAIAIAALSGVAAYVIGAAALTTNYFLIQGDTKSVMLNAAKTRLFFKGLSPKLGIGLSIHLVLSIATGLLSGGAAFGLILKVLHLTIASATAGPIALAGIVAFVTTIGMGSLYYAGVAKIIRSLKGLTWKDVIKKDISGEPIDKKGKVIELDKKGKPLNEKDKFIILQKGIRTRIIEKAKSINIKPPYNREVLELQDSIAELKKRLNRPGITANMQTDLETQLKMLTRKKAFAQKIHVTRHWLSVIFTGVLLPFALAFAFITSVAKMEVSYTGTATMFQIFFGASKKLAGALAWGLTWFVAFPVNTALYGNSLTKASMKISPKLSALITAIATTIKSFFVHIYERKLGNAMKDTWHTFTNHPAKTLYPGLRALALLVGCFFVALNADGNASTYVKNATIGIPSLRFIAPFCVSASLNGLAIYAKKQELAPIDRLEANAEKGSYGKFGAELKNAEGKTHPNLKEQLNEKYIAWMNKGNDFKISYKDGKFAIIWRDNKKNDVKIPKSSLDGASIDKKKTQTSGGEEILSN